ncbi:DUF3955 domain-containing protein [Lactococcus petauri]|uniref:DUF3955 domain-containing protein n=1 Tax=Lactococcus petauri TaxID=1940789 RepID=UPI0018AA0CF0|nr:DUF3955 domain-containing protein [Lactococcus petauri]MDC0825741.1 DUF3955 domain-containing protein [Lactococcus petauri]
MFKKYLIPLSLIIVALIVPFIGVSMTTIDEQGVVHEPLYIVTLAIALFIIGIMWVLVLAMKSFKRK